MRRTIRLALDWTPNTNHTGFYVARAHDLFKEVGISVEFIVPGTPEAKGLTPGRLCAAGVADFAIAPSESAISFASTEFALSSGIQLPRPLAVAAVLQGSTSAICALPNSGIKRPADLAGRRYASYGGRFEEAIVQQMIRNDGGDWNSVRIHTLPKHGYTPDIEVESSVVAANLKHGLSDATWIFEHWEGILAKRSGVQLTCLRLEDYGIPYGYSPVLLASPALIHDAGETGLQIIRDFLSAAAKGFEMAVADSDAAALILQKEGAHPSLDNLEFLCESQKYMCTEYLDSRGTWGRMELRRWDEFVQFLLKNQIVTLRDGAAVSSIEAQDVFTNEFLP